MSAKDFDDFAGQVRDAIRFLKRHGAAVRKLRRFPGVEDATLDFGIVWHDVAVQADVLPAELVLLAGKCGLAVEVSHYPIATARRSKRARRRGIARRRTTRA